MSKEGREPEEIFMSRKERAASQGEESLRFSLVRGPDPATDDAQKPTPYFQQIEENIERSAEIVARLLGIAPDRAGQVVRLGENFALRKELVQLAIKPYLDGELSAKALLPVLKKRVDDLDLLYHEVRASEFASTITQMSQFNREQLDSAIGEAPQHLREALMPNGTFKYVLGKFVVLELWSLAGFLKAAEEHGFAHLKTAAANFETLTRSKQPQTAEYYLIDLLAHTYAQGGFTPDDMRHLVENQLFSDRTAQAFTQIAAIPAVAITAPHVEYYRKIAEQGVAGLLPMHTVAREHLLPVLAEWESTLDRISNLPKDRNAVKELMVAAGELNAFQMLEMLIERPGLCGLMRGLSHHKISAKEFAKSVLTPTLFTLEDDAGEKIIDRLLELGAEPSRLPAVASLLRQHEGLAAAACLLPALEVAAGRYSSQLTIKYCEFIAAGHQYKAALCLELSRDPSAIRSEQELKLMLHTISSRSDSDVLEALQAPSAMEMLNKLKRVVTKGGAEGSAAPVARVTWSDQLLFSLKEQGNLDLERLVRRSLHAANKELELRLKNIWVSAPALLEPFCQQLSAFSDNGLFKFVLSSSTLFERYKQALLHDPDKLVEVFQSYGSSSPPERYPSQLDQAFALTQPDSPTAAAGQERGSASEQQRTIKYDVKHLIISGGNISQLRQEAIRSALTLHHPNLEVAFFGDTFAPARFRGAIDQDTWVLHLPHCANHGLRNSMSGLVRSCVEEIKRRSPASEVDDLAEVKKGPIFEVMPGRGTGTKTIVEYVSTRLN